MGWTGGWSAGMRDGPNRLPLLPLLPYLPDGSRELFHERGINPVAMQRGEEAGTVR
jgi:hypothetical protein